MFKVLLVDDELEILRDYSRLINEMGYQCIVAQNGQEAIDILKQEQPDVILTDQKMPKKSGMAVLEEARLFDKEVPVIIITGYGTVNTAVDAMKIGAFDYLQKPFPPEKMQAVLEKAIDHRTSKESYVKPDEQEDKHYKLDGVVGKSNVIADIARRIVKVAPSQSNILIYGESGTGKELIARNIHLKSGRRNKPFIPLDCSALPFNLLESEIFGHEKGAFTGADRAKPGVIELANQGTLFLDEITELEHGLQSKLLRFIQERHFRRVGGQKLIHVDVRIISATNRNPEQAVKDAILRSDLYYRLNVVPMFLAPLRQRTDDIPLLVNHFIKKFNPSFSRDIKGVTSDAMLCLKKHTWPGNVRELQNIIEQAMSLADNNIIDLADLPMQIRENYELYVEEVQHGQSFKDAKEKFVKKFGKKYFEDLIKQCDGNISKTARLAGISRSSIYRILDEFDIDVPK